MSEKTKENNLVTDELIKLAYRLLLDREPDHLALEKKNYDTVQDLHKKIIYSKEYQNHLQQIKMAQDLDTHDPVALNYRHWVWAWRALLDRNPHKNELSLDVLNRITTTQGAREYIMRSAEFNVKNKHITISQPAVLIKEIVNKLRVYVDLGDWDGSRLVAADQIDYTPYLKTFDEILTAGDRALDLGHSCGVFTILMASFVGENGHINSWDTPQTRTDLIARSVEENNFQSRQSTVQDSEQLWGESYKLIRVANTDLFNMYQDQIENQVNTCKSYLIYPKEITYFKNLSSHRSQFFNDEFQVLEPYPWS